MPAAKKAAASRKASSPEMDESPKGSGLRVSAPLVQVQIGSQVLHLFNGDVLPDGVSREQLDHLVRLGYVTGSDDE